VAIGIGIWFAVVGAVAALAGMSSMRRSRQLRSRGVSAWATVVRRRAAAGELPAEQDSVVQYMLEDGRVIEREFPGSWRRRTRLAPGARVLVWYDPADPGDVLVFGRETRRTDQVFVALGTLLVIAGVAVASLSP
jgi:hypothetical protein